MNKSLKKGERFVDNRTAWKKSMLMLSAFYKLYLNFRSPKQHLLLLQKYLLKVHRLKALCLFGPEFNRHICFGWSNVMGLLLWCWRTIIVTLFDARVICESDMICQMISQLFLSNKTSNVQIVIILKIKSKAIRLPFFMLWIMYIYVLTIYYFYFTLKYMSLVPPAW